MPLRWVPQYNQWWCDNCRMYLGFQTDEQRLSMEIGSFGRALERDLGMAPNQPACGRCGRYMRWVPEYQRWYCDGCMAYL